MKSTAMTALCRILMFTLMTLSFQTAQAGMITTPAVTAAATAQADRTTVLDMLTRADTAGQLQTMGVDSQIAVERVAAMTDAEVHSLAGQLNALPAGGDGLVALILVVFFIWYFAFRR